MHNKLTNFHTPQGQQDDSINLQIVYAATTQTDFIVKTK